MNLPCEAESALVTVIVPSYNHGRFLPDCIESILRQNYCNVEVIVVDDGSTDNSMEVLKSYQDRIRIITQRGGRQARARNLALDVARGEYVAFLDSDDRFLGERLRSAIDVLVARPEVDLVWADYRLVNQNGDVLAEKRWEPKCDDFQLELIAGNPICNATVTVRRRVLNEIGGFDERAPRACDGAAWYQIAARGGCFLHLERVVLDYRVHDANDSGRFVPMTRDRDIALMLAAQAYVSRGVLSTSKEKKWLRNVLIRQLGFRAAAWVQRDLSSGKGSSVRATLYEALGSECGLSLLSNLAAMKKTLRRFRP